MRTWSCLDRRTLLRGALAGFPVALGLPCLEAMLDGNGEAHADGTPLLRRFGVWFFGAGAHREWSSAPTGALALPRGLTPLERHRSLVTIVSGLSFASFGDFGTNRHHMGASSVLTGTPPRGEAPGGASVDQLVAAHLRQGRRASLELSVCDGGTISYAGAGGPNRPIGDPRKALASLFGAPAPAPAGAPGATPAARRELRGLYLDALLGEVEALRPRLGARDRQRLEGYLDGLRELEKEVVLTVPASSAEPAACGPPADAAAGITDATIANRGGSFTALNRAMSKVLAAALACGQTQVFSFNFSSPNSTPWFRPAQGLANNHHELGHQMHGDLPRSVEYVMERLAETLDALAAHREGTGTVLERTGILVTSEVARNHESNNMPILLLGGPGAGLRGGQHVRAAGATTKASLTLARAVGAPLAAFGTGEARATEVIGGVLV